MRRQRLGIIGNGMATCRLLDELVRRGAQERYEVSVYGEETGGAYSRVLLSRVLAGGEPDDIVTKPRAWYEANGVRLIDDTKIGRIDRARTSLVATHGRDFFYDLAVIATGSQPLVPPIQGMTGRNGDLATGVFVYRKMDDCLRMRAHAKAARGAVVLGGGLLGLEAAKVLRDLGLAVTVVHVAETVLNAQLDLAGGGMLRRRIEAFGIALETGRTVEAIAGDEKVEAVFLDDGRSIATDMVVLACGVRPRVDVALASGLAVNRGIVVDDGLATDGAGIYAVGECVEHAGRTYGIVSPVREQASVLAALLTGASPQARYHGSNSYSRLKVAGVDVASMGLLEPERETDAVIQVIEERRSAYRKLIVREGMILGAMLVGDTSAAAALAQAYDRGDLLPDDPLEALCPGSVPRSGSIGERTVCNCHEVTESSIRRAVSGGANSVDAVGVATRAGTGCGSCRAEIAQLVGRPRPTPVEGRVEQRAASSGQLAYPE